MKRIKIIKFDITFNFIINNLKKYKLTKNKIIYKYKKYIYYQIFQITKNLLKKD